MKLRSFVKKVFSQSWRDYKKNAAVLTPPAVLCIFSIFLPVLLEEINMPVAVSFLILVPGAVLLYLCVYAGFYTAKHKSVKVSDLISHSAKTVAKSVAAAWAGIVVFCLPFMVYFMIPAEAEVPAFIAIAYICLSVIIILFDGWVTFFCFYGMLDGKPLKSVLFKSLKYLKKNLFKLFALLFIVVLVFMAADMTIIGLFVVFPMFTVLFANLYFQLHES